MACIRLISETAASLPLEVYQTVDGELTEPAEYSYQANLLEREPNENQTAFQVWSHTLAAMLGWGNAYLLKAKARGEVQALYPLDPSRVTPKVTDGKLEFIIRTFSDQPHDPKATRLTSDDVLHVPGLLLTDPNIGVSPIAVHRHVLGNAISQLEYSSRYYNNDGSPGGLITVPGQLTKEKREELKEAWESRHRGTAAAHRVGVLTGGATFETVGINLRDAQFIEGLESSTRDICRIFGVPAGMLDAQPFSSRTTPEEDMSRFQLRLTPWLRRLESALESDKDLFPDVDRAGVVDNDPCVRFDTNHLVRADINARFGAYTSARQGGWMSANEIREMENLPPVDGGDTVQITPVGGAPNDNTAVASGEGPGDVAQGDS
jgi:HK97 family phage portal protein